MAIPWEGLWGPEKRGPQRGDKGQTKLRPLKHSHSGAWHRVRAQECFLPLHSFSLKGGCILVKVPNTQASFFFLS